jgi:hypothetical protein
MKGVRITGLATAWGPTASVLGAAHRDPGALSLPQDGYCSQGSLWVQREIAQLGRVSLSAPDEDFAALGEGHGGTQIRFGDQRVELRSGGTLDDAAYLLAGLARANVRAMERDADLRDEAIRRTLSPPIDRCYVKGDQSVGMRHDCTGESGYQYASDEEQQALEGCRPSDVWSDIRALLAGHEQAKRGPKDPIVCDCDDLAPAAAGVYAWLAWFGKDGLTIPKGSWYGDDGKKIQGLGDSSRKARFALAITRPPRAPIAHAYVLTSQRPKPPQPPIRLAGSEGESWWVLDPAAHWGMPRPQDSFYGYGEVVAHELRHDSLEGLKVLP